MLRSWVLHSRRACRRCIWINWKRQISRLMNWRLPYRRCRRRLDLDKSQGTLRETMKIEVLLTRKSSHLGTSLPLRMSSCFGRDRTKLTCEESTRKGCQLTKGTWWPWMNSWANWDTDWDSNRASVQNTSLPWNSSRRIRKDWPSIRAASLTQNSSEAQ